MAVKLNSRMLQLAFTVAVITLSLYLVCDANLLSRRYCSFFYRFSKTKRDCILCTDHCPSGQGLEQNCGYNEYGNRVKPACSPCKDGYFSPIRKKPRFDFPSLPCRRCKQCYPASRTKQKCTAKRNTRCSRCPKGMYKDRDGHCYKCSYCCDGMLERGVNVVHSCKRRNNGRCVCKEFTKCYGSTGNNSHCPAYRY